MNTRSANAQQLKIMSEAMSIVYPFPVLHEHTMDYKDPSAYSTEMRRSGRAKILIDHCLSRNTLVGSLVLQGKAAFYGSVSIRGTSFRCTRLASNEGFEAGQEMLAVQQAITIPEYPWSPEVFACSGVVSLDSISVKSSEHSDLGDFFMDSDDIDFPAHAKIAFKDWVRFFSLGALFHLYSEKNMADGTFFVDMAKNDRLQISIRLPQDLFDKIIAHERSGVRRHVLCSALTQGFQELMSAQQLVNETEDSGGNEEAEQLLELAEGLKKYLEENDIPTWEEESFNPSGAASSLYRVEDTEDDEELED